MAEPTGNYLLHAIHWAARRPACMLLTSPEEKLRAEPPGRFRLAWIGLLAWSLAWGLLLVGAWAAAWAVSGAFGILWAPAAAVLAVHLAWPYRRAVACLADRAGRDPSRKALVCAAYGAALALCLIELRPHWYRMDGYLPVWLQWLRPAAKLYRPLLLMPLWGAWAMLIVPQFCRANEGTSPAVAAMAAGCGPLVAAGSMGALLLLSIIYFSYLPWWHLSVLGATIAAAIGGGLAFCRSAGGLARGALLAANALTQIVFLVAYVVAQQF